MLGLRSKGHLGPGKDPETYASLRPGQGLLPQETLGTQLIPTLG